MSWTEEEYQAFIDIKMGPNKPQVKKKVSKYRNIKTIVDGITFDIKKETDYYCQLKMLKRAGEIRDFGLQQKYELQPTFEKNGTTYQAISYVVDFIITNNNGTTVVIDIKGMETKEFKIKKKLFE